MNKRILVTGGAGFIGSHLCESLVDKDYQVVAIDNLSTGSLENIKHLQQHPDFQFVRETITNLQVLDRLSSEADIIVHLAAAVGVQLIVENPVYTIQTNIMGTEAVLSTANRYSCKVLIASTSEVYGKGVKIPFCENDDRLMGSTTHSRWSYAASKAIDEFLGLAYHHQYGLPVVVMRFFNTVGPRQTGRYGMVVPRFIKQALNNEPLTVYGDGKQSRCFCDVADIVWAVQRLMENKDAVGQVFNLGSDEEIRILDLAKKVITKTKSNSTISFIPYEAAYAPGFEDMRKRVPSLTKLRNLTGYSPKYSLDQILDRIIKFETENTLKQT